MIFQYGSAALLFWESVTSSTSFDLVGSELQLQDFAEFPPTWHERLVGRLSSFSSILVFFGGILLIAIHVFILFKPGETENLIKAEIVVIGGGILLFGFIQYAGKMIQASLIRYAIQIRKLQMDEEKRQVTKRMIRQIAFVVFSLGSIIQISLAIAD